MRCPRGQTGFGVAAQVFLTLVSLSFNDQSSHVIARHICGPASYPAGPAQHPGLSGNKMNC